MSNASLQGSMGAFVSMMRWGTVAAVVALCAPTAFAARQNEARPPAQAEPKSPAQADAKPPGEATPPADSAAQEQDKTAEEMARTRADLLAKHQGADEARLTQLMGPPAEKGTKEAGLTLVWRGPAGGGDPLPCRISATLVEGGLANIELAGHPTWDRKTCRKFLRPLLQALPWRAIEHGPNDGNGAAATLGNDAVVQMVKDGLPTQAILGRVRSQPCKFDLSSDAANAMRRGGVPESVLQAMGERNCP